MFVKFVKDDKVVQEVSISPEMIPFPTDTVVLEEGKFTVENMTFLTELVQDGSKLQAVKHVKESAKCGLKEAKDFMDTYCEYVL